mmetsp:Transcript_33149/g.107211  ORF Transcript_33149/g.107211 Transcript_33149/m.107211 type:complete len:237 (-) Transcript_33149:10-720(-)
MQLQHRQLHGLAGPRAKQPQQRVHGRLVLLDGDQVGGAGEGAVEKGGEGRVGVVLKQLLDGLELVVGGLELRLLSELAHLWRLGRSRCRWGLRLLHPTIAETKLPMDCRVPVVLNRVVCPARKQLCNLGPLVAKLLLPLQQDLIFLRSPLALRQVGVELVVPALAALLAVAVGHLLRDLRPLLRPFELDQHPQVLVLVLRPWLAVAVRLRVVLLAHQSLPAQPARRENGAGGGAVK